MKNVYTYNGRIIRATNHDYTHACIRKTIANSDEIYVVSCNKNKEELILGKWECVAASFTDDGETYPVTDAIGLIWDFKANGTVVASHINQVDDSDTASYSLLDDVLTTTFTNEFGNSDVNSYTIKELNKNKLLLESRNEKEVLTIEFKRI